MWYFVAGAQSGRGVMSWWDNWGVPAVAIIGAITGIGGSIFCGAGAIGSRACIWTSMLWKMARGRNLMCDRPIAFGMTTLRSLLAVM